MFVSPAKLDSIVAGRNLVYQSLKKGDGKIIDGIEDGVLVDDVGNIGELEGNLLSKYNLCLFDDDLKLVKNEEDCAEFKVRLNYLNFENKIRIPINILKVIRENFEEIEYSKRLQLSYLNILFMFVAHVTIFPMPLTTLSPFISNTSYSS